MLHAELQSRLLILILLRWDEMISRFPTLHRMLDRELMAACATCDLELSLSFQTDLYRARQHALDVKTVNKLLGRHLDQWLERL